jgi:hypothetical protein
LIGKGVDGMGELEFDVFYQYVFDGTGVKKIEKFGGEKRKTESEGEGDGKEVKKGKLDVGVAVPEGNGDQTRTADDGHVVVPKATYPPLLTNEAPDASFAKNGAQASNVDITSNGIHESEPTTVNQHSTPPQESISLIGDQHSISPVKIDFSQFAPLRAKYSDIVSSRSQVIWEEHRDPNGGGFVCSCRVMSERVFVGKRLCADGEEAREDVARDVVMALYPEVFE